MRLVSAAGHRLDPRGELKLLPNLGTCGWRRGSVSDGARVGELSNGFGT
jgi:hypothetical protein